MKQNESIIVNQLGYRIFDYKIAYITHPSDQFQIVDQSNNQIVWTGISTTESYDKSSGSTVSKLDFTSLQTEGNYIVQGNSGYSLPFSIQASNYDEVHKALLKAFYFYRCGIELHSSFAEQWTHKACHTTPAIILDDPLHRTIEANGGWHDAGDYGKYIVAAGKAVTDLLLAYEYYPDAFKAKIPLPESDEKMDDVLHEVKIELLWMLKMQNKEHGGVYHKLTTQFFPPLDMMPEDDTADLYVLPVSSTATASFAATLALAARIYAKHDLQFSQTLLDAAEQAWQWLENNSQLVAFKNPDGIFTGEYGDECDDDERYWASAELYRTTGKTHYHERFKHYSNLTTFHKCLLGWADMGGYGTISYLMCEQPTDAALLASLKKQSIQYSDELVAISNEDGFGISLKEDEYLWGSNMEMLNHAMFLLLIQKLENHQEYEKVITSHLHYLLGANINRYSYITGYGSRPIANPHHRPTVADGVDAPVPGLVSGGPNKNLQDPCAKQHCEGNPSAACFVDHIDSYATNEVTIYWNSPAVFLLSAFVS